MSFIAPSGDNKVVMASIYAGLGLSAATLLFHNLVSKTNSQEEETEVDPLDELSASQLDKHLVGLEQVFSVEAIRSSRVSPAGCLRKYTFAVGLPNVANTCYMNSLLQALSGCTEFTSYIDRLWKHITIDEDSDDEGEHHADVAPECLAEAGGVPVYAAHEISNCSA